MSVYKVIGMAIKAISKETGESIVREEFAYRLIRANSAQQARVRAYKSGLTVIERVAFVCFDHAINAEALAALPSFRGYDEAVDVI